MTTPNIDYADVQGTVLRGYRVALARHFILSVTDAASARAFIADLVNGTGGVPKITTAAPWTTKPESFVNIAFTAKGLSALGVADLSSFEKSFQLGATDPDIAAGIGDVGSSAPENWIGGLNDGAQVHVVLSLWAHEDSAVLERVSGQLRAGFAAGMKELSAHDAQALPDNGVHFGYRDNIAQPTIDGAPPRKNVAPDAQPVVPTGEFLLGYTNAYGVEYSVKPDALSKNSSYAAFRILQQDAAAFEQFLQEYAPTVKLTPEMLAAKVCGRWRNGNPLSLAPTEAGDPLPADQLNNFNYVDTTDPKKDDTLGLVCPVGSHIRRNNPRNQAITGGADAMHHRIVRRAMPYGPAFDPQKPDDGPRGLIGYFINASIQNQFEFLEGQWNQTAKFVKSATDANGSNDGNASFNISGQDVFLGVNDPNSSTLPSSFTLPGLGRMYKGNQNITGWSRMITTVGGAYVFLPSITGLRYLASLT